MTQDSNSAGVQTDFPPNSDKISSVPAKVFKGKSDIVSVNASVIQENIKDTMSRNKLLIVGDEFARGCSQILNKLVDTQRFHIEGFIKSNACIGELTMDFFGKVKDFTERDYVVVMFNRRNVRHARQLQRVLSDILPMSKFMNMTIITEIDCTEQSQYYVDIITGAINRFHSLNRNVSLELFCQYNRGSNRLSKLNACNLIKNCVRREN